MPMRPTSRLLSVILLLPSLLPAPAHAQSAPRLTQSAVAGGGGVSAQGPVRVEGTVGQPAAGESSGGAFTLSGGFQSLVAAQPALSVSDVARAEGNAGAATFTFDVTLDSPAGTGGVTFDIATSDGMSSHAASGDDYAARALTGQTIPAGQTAYQFTVEVSGDTTQEASETFFVNISNAAGATLARGQGAGTILNDDGAPAAGQVVISEFRQRGPAPAGAAAAGNEQGQLDEFIELYNNTDSDIVVADSAPASAATNGWAIVSSDDVNTPKYVIPAGTVIPARSHFLVTNSAGYSLSAYAAADTVADPAASPVPASYTADIPGGAGIALLRTGSVATATPADRLDSVGFAPGPSSSSSRPAAAAPPDAAPAAVSVFAEAAPLDPGAVSIPAEHSYARLLRTGRPQDSDDNRADFAFVTTDGGSYDGIQSVLGAPGPQNSQSPAQSNNKIKASLIDPTVSSGESPNSVRRQCPPSPQADPSVEECDGARSRFGTFSIRRRWTNTTGAGVNTLRFRLVDVTTLNSPGYAPANGQADLRAISSSQVTGVSVTSVVSPGATVTVEGTTLESPSSASSGGGLNSALLAGTVSLSEPLAPGASVNLQFLLGVQQPGAYRFFINVEALTDAPAPPGSRSKAGAAQPKAAQGTK